MDRYEQVLGELVKQPAGDPRIVMQLENRDLDTGYRVKPGSYPLTDKTYAELLDKLTKHGSPVPEELKQDIEDYYSDPNAPIVTRKHKKAWARVQKELAQLQTMPVVQVHAAE